MTLSTQDPRVYPGMEDLIALARLDFGVFAVLHFPELHDGHEMISAPYVDLIVEALMRTRTGGAKRVIINLPPGHMKSMLSSILYSAWLLGVNPWARIICISYSDDLAHHFSRMTRRLMLSRIYQRTFPGTVLEKHAQDSLTTTRGGQRMATAVNSSIAGFRADCIIIDDPMQPDAAASENGKQTLRDYYFGVVEQRLLPDGVIVLVMHRLAPDDLTATFIEAGGWLHLALPLIANKFEKFTDRHDRTLLRRERGDLLSPRWLTYETAEERRRSLPPHIFEAQYQQNPQFGGSGICSIDRIARYRDPPAFELLIHSWDIASTKGGGDYTVCAKFGVAKDAEQRDILYLIPPVIRARVELPDVRELIIAQDDLDKPALIIMDGVGIGVGVYQDLMRLGLKNVMPSGSMQKENIGGLKTLRFHAALLPLYDGLVRFPETMPGLETLLNEFAAFPDGKNDDQVDAIGNVAANREYVVRSARQNATRLGRYCIQNTRSRANEPPAKSRDQELHDRRRRDRDQWD
jgi:phage terminase large subunit-like protein